jgi:uncharacterized membrane protein
MNRNLLLSQLRFDTSSQNMQALEKTLQRWIRAGLLDEATAERIRQYEASRERPAGLRWQVLLALIFGAILLAAGVTLFVAAHWAELSPAMRFMVVMGMLVVLHGSAVMVRPQFEGLATALHGVGTVAAGAAVALVGQIFNMQEHWPAGVLLWALCALAGWALLRDQVQETISLLLLPAWLICEWRARTDGYRGADILLIRLVVVLAAVYLTGFLRSKRRLVSGVLFTAGALTLASCTALLDYAGAEEQWRELPPVPTAMLVILWLCVIALPLLLAWRLDPASVLPVAVVALMALLLPRLYSGPLKLQYPLPQLVGQALIALVAAFLAWWGVQQRSRALVNYGIICFALCVVWFYFSSIMGKLERSLGLILLGLLFLGGGWLLEKIRRRLVRRIQEAT